MASSSPADSEVVVIVPLFATLKVRHAFFAGTGASESVNLNSRRLAGRDSDGRQGLLGLSCRRPTPRRRAGRARQPRRATTSSATCAKETPRVRMDPIAALHENRGTNVRMLSRPGRTSEYVRRNDLSHDPALGAGQTGAECAQLAHAGRRRDVDFAHAPLAGIETGRATSRSAGSDAWPSSTTSPPADPFPEPLPGSPRRARRRLPAAALRLRRHRRRASRPEVRMLHALLATYAPTAQMEDFVVQRIEQFVYLLADGSEPSSRGRSRSARPRRQRHVRSRGDGHRHINLVEMRPRRW